MNGPTNHVSGVDDDKHDDAIGDDTAADDH